MGLNQSGREQSSHTQVNETLCLSIDGYLAQITMGEKANGQDARTLLPRRNHHNTGYKHNISVAVTWWIGFVRWQPP